jgi:hypothetical protein
MTLIRKQAMAKWSLLFLTALVAALLPLLGVGWRHGTANAAGATLQGTIRCPTQSEMQVADLINAERTKKGLPPLAIDIRLQEAAVSHSEDMANNDFFSHTGSDGSSLIDRLERAGYPWHRAGENIAAGLSNPASAVAGWMDSPGHRANILNPSYEQLGVGYAFESSATYRHYWTSDFGASTDGGQPPPAECFTTMTPTPTPTPKMTPTKTPLPTPTHTFLDVPRNHWAFSYIEALHQAGYVAGCSLDPPLYCPEDTMTRAESAVFIERGRHGAAYQPPNPTSQTFADVPLAEWFAKWAEGLWNDSFTAGCGTDPLLYCPFREHNRTEGSVFFLRMREGPDYVPPTPIGLFADVPTDFWGAKWLEAAYNAGLIPACQTQGELLFCPEDPLNRAMAAYMMVQAKGLQLP